MANPPACSTWNLDHGGARAVLSGRFQIQGQPLGMFHVERWRIGPHEAQRPSRGTTPGSTSGYPPRGVVLGGGNAPGIEPVRRALDRGRDVNFRLPDRSITRSCGSKHTPTFLRATAPLRGRATKWLEQGAASRWMHRKAGRGSMPGRHVTEAQRSEAPPGHREPGHLLARPLRCAARSGGMAVRAPHGQRYCLPLVESRPKQWKLSPGCLWITPGEPRGFHVEHDGTFP